MALLFGRFGTPGDDRVAFRLPYADAGQLFIDHRIGLLPVPFALYLQTLAASVHGIVQYRLGLANLLPCRRIVVAVDVLAFHTAGDQTALVSGALPYLIQSQEFLECALLVVCAEPFVDDRRGVVVGDHAGHEDDRIVGGHARIADADDGGFPAPIQQ